VRPPSEITLAEIMSALPAPVVGFRARRHDDAGLPGSSEHLAEVWLAVRSAMRKVLEAVTLADLASGRLPPEVAALIDDPSRDIMSIRIV
jgi:DNA-binding IscR family transcriptional regulator